MDDRHVSAEELEAYQTLIPVPSWSSATGEQVKCSC